jgi:hypothetical protein
VNYDPVFFGHTTDIEEITRRLKDTPRLTIVAAPARSGKTSFLAAGLWVDVSRFMKLSVPSLWTWTVLSGDPVESLQKWKREQLESDLTSYKGENPGLDKEKLELHSSELPLGDAHRRISEERSTVLWIDQVERPFDADEESTDEFLSELADAVERDTGMHLILTIRSEFLEQLLAHRHLGPLVGDALFDLPLMSREAMSEAITGPAEEFSLPLEEGLVAQILDDVGDGPAAIQSVSIVMKTLWEARPA